MTYIYKLTQSEITDEGGVTHTVYGIEAFEKGKDIPKRSVHDIFTDFDTADKFVRSCNILGLDIEHLDDVVYDIVNK